MFVSFETVRASEMQAFETTETTEMAEMQTAELLETILTPTIRWWNRLSRWKR